MSKISHLILGLFLLSALPVSAEVISITDPRYSVPNDASGVVRPTRGMSMNAVAQYYGQPSSKTATIGQPPITKWTYPEFVVFFEYSTVIHSVVPRQ
ncbi:MAG: hypothetical protein HN475_02010 [Piscirickettsiaceae bacterium]|nr:hypothetical protein [Piscirickettsiaceae bacterium]